MPRMPWKPSDMQKKQYKSNKKRRNAQLLIGSWAFRPSFLEKHSDGIDDEQMQGIVDVK